MSEDGVRIEFGEIEYLDQGSKFMGEVMSKVTAEVSKRAETPASVRDAFLFREARVWSYVKELGEIFMEEGAGEFDDDGQWQGEDTSQLTQRLMDYVNLDEYISRKIEAETKIVSKGMELIDLQDQENVQIVLSRDWSEGELVAGAFMYLVVYPPKMVDGRMVKKREVSFPTAMCHALSAVALLDESSITKIFGKSGNSEETGPLKVVKLDDRKISMRLLKTSSVSDEELEDIVSTHGRTLADKLTQTGLAVLDKLRGRKGEHVDVVSALRNQEYALLYALACHRGIGRVKNEKINLPQIITQKNA
jgi:hypothetical protein